MDFKKFLLSCCAVGVGLWCREVGRDGGNTGSIGAGVHRFVKEYFIEVIIIQNSNGDMVQPTNRGCYIIIFIALNGIVYQ